MVNLREKFKIQVYRAEGNSFQALFSDVMVYKHADFKPVAPHGNAGDGGNDGYIPSSGTYYQVYAPEDLSTNAIKAVSKVRSDVKKIQASWALHTPMRRFFFVLNDKFRGVPEHIRATLTDIQREESLEEAGVYTTSNLEEDLFSLPIDKLCSVLRVNPIEHFGYDDRQRVRDYLDKIQCTFWELFESGSEAGYFFPASLLDQIEHLRHGSDYSRLRSTDFSIARQQRVISDTLISAIRLVRYRPGYQLVGQYLRYEPILYEPISSPQDRDRLIDLRKREMGKLLKKVQVAWNILNAYAEGCQAPAPQNAMSTTVCRPAAPRDFREHH